MTKRDQTRVSRARARQPQTGSMRWRTYSLMLVCGLTLLSGIFLAGRQHFSSMDYGMKNSRLRKQVDELEGEKRRLLLARAISLSPAEIKKAAKKNGLLDMTPVTGEVAQVISTTKEKAIPTKEKVIPTALSEAKSMVVKTAAVSAVQTASTANYPKSAKLVKPTRATLSAQ